MIPRIIENQIQKALKGGFVVGLFGARRTGKTVMMKSIYRQLDASEVIYVQGDDLDSAGYLSSQRLSVLKRFVGNNKYLFIDEAQMIPKIGINLKLLTDSMPELRIFITGSSSFSLGKQIGEPLTGRSKYFYLYPLTISETYSDYLSYRSMLPEYLIYGTYPAVITLNNISEKKDRLESIRNGYLLKDVLALDNNKDSGFVLKLLQLIALQIGNDVSFSELGQNLNAHKKTIQRYLKILEEAFVIFSLHGFSRNMRKEYSKTPRYYFWDNGIRNIVLKNFNDLNTRDDTGKLWENYCISEIIKKSVYEKRDSMFYFWRTYDKQEIDLIENRGGKLFSYECKWNPNKQPKIPAGFKKAYPEARYFVINPENLPDFLL
ncbi:MAG: ATP-binding protein [Bacteroidota bacterium]|nr:ATP-binding protein [Bacteroidota bacterium]